MKERASPLNLLFMGLALFFLWVAWDQLQITARYADLSYLNATLTSQDSGNKTVIDRYAALADDAATANACRSDVLDGGLTFVMRDLDLQNSVDQYDAWAAAMMRADRYVTHALSCSPGDGDLWARLAMIRQASSENPEQLSALLSRSALLAPSEMYVLRARFFVWRRAGVDTLDRSATALGQDITTILNYATPKEIIDVLGHAGVNLKPRILAAMKVIPPARLADLKSKQIDADTF